VTTGPLGRLPKEDQLPSTEQDQAQATHGRLRSWASAVAESVLGRAFYVAAPILERSGIIFPAVHPEDGFALSAKGRHKADVLIAMREYELSQGHSNTLESSLVEPTDLDHVPDLEFVVEAPFHIAKGTVTTLYGLGGVGKTSFAAALAAHIALGRPFLGARLRQGRVFYGEFEGAGQLLARTTKKIIAALEQDHPGAAEALKSTFVQKHYTAKEKADWRYARGMIPALIRQLGKDYDVVILDSYEGATMGDSNDAQEAAEMMQLFAQLAAETNTAVILIDHAPKHNPTSVFGSTKKTDFARVVIHISTEGGSDGRRLVLKSAKCNVAPKPVFRPVERKESDDALRFVEATTITMSIGATGAAAQHERTKRQIEAAIERGAKTRSEIYEDIQIEDGYKSSDGPRKRVKRLGLQHMLPEQQHGQKRGA
jgi:RecA/RadA recombinase